MNILYGAGSLGKSFARTQNLWQSESWFFVDSDARLWGHSWHGVPIYEPTRTRLLTADSIIITTMWVREVYERLRDIGVPHESIWVPVKRMLSPQQHDLFRHTNASIALALLSDAFSEMNRWRVAAHIDFGALLGLWRDGVLIPGDTDVDISAFGDLGTEHTAFADAIQSAANVRHLSTRRSELLHHSCVTVEVGDELLPITVDQCELRNGGVVNLRNPHFPPVSESVVFPLVEHPDLHHIKVPHQPDAYLELRYGKSWRTPTDDWAFLYGVHDLGLQTLTTLTQLEVGRSEV